jgi:predicted secreted protein
MNNRDHFFGTRVETALATAALSSAATQNGVAIDVSNVAAIAFVEHVSVFSTGTFGIQDVQFADDSSFTTNVVTITSDDFLMKNDRSSATSAIAQTVLAATGRRKLSLENRAVNSQKWCRVRTVTTGTVSLTASVIALLDFNEQPVVQA